MRSSVSRIDHRLGRSIGCFALALVGFAMVVAFIGAAAPLPPPDDIREKLLAFERERDTADVLFFGSSRVHRGVDPRVFDEAMRAAGVPVHSFNFAMRGMRSHETNALLRRVLATRPARLRWVVLEWRDWDPWIAPANWYKRRPVFWHDAQETRSALSSVWLSDLDRLAKLRLAGVHALHFLQRTLSIGQGPDALRALFGRAEIEAPPSPAEIERRGFYPFSPEEYTSGVTAEHRRKFLSDTDAFEGTLRRASRASQSPVDLSKTNQRALVSQIETVRAAGAEPVYLVMPIPQPTPEADALAAEGVIPHLIAFNDADLFPEFYQQDARFDRGHLNAQGAELLSRALARRFAAELDRGTTND